MTSFVSRFGHAIHRLRPGIDALAMARFGTPTLTLASAAFENGGAIPIRFTGDGAGLFPPLQWSGMPEGTVSLALLVEDADAPFPRPLVHLLLHAMPATLQGLAEGAVPTAMAHSRMFSVGRNSLGRRAWLPPTPIPGHGPHRYAFQVFALATAFAPRRIPGRGALLVTARRSLLGYGRLIGTYERP
jgi:phosphatidylethanolamine-binding protein (PEBP) family uncharacterized protein